MSDRGAPLMYPAWRAYVRVLQVVCATLLVSIVAVTLANVLSRYFLAQPIVWTDEVARMTFVVFTFLAMGLAGATNRHLSVDTFMHRLGPRGKKIIDALVLVATVAFALFLMYGGYRAAVGAIGQATPALRLPRWWINASVPIGGLLLLISTLGSARYGTELAELEGDRVEGGRETKA